MSRKNELMYPFCTSLRPPISPRCEQHPEETGEPPRVGRTIPSWCRIATPGWDAFRDERLYSRVCDDRCSFEGGTVTLREFDAQLQKGDNPGAWTCVVMGDVAALFGTRGLVKIRGAIDGEPFVGALIAQGDGTHRLRSRPSCEDDRQAGRRHGPRPDRRAARLAPQGAVSPSARNGARTQVYFVSVILPVVVFGVFRESWLTALCTALTLCSLASSFSALFDSLIVILRV